MPVAAKHPCANAALGCRQLADGRFCSRCRPEPEPEPAHRWDADRRSVPRVRGRQLQARRKALFAREPLCRVCRAQGRVSAATIRDHVVPLAEGGSDEDDNVQPLCECCSDSKTREESKRGRDRADPR